MLFTIVTVICVTVYFLLMFTGGKSWREVREMFYGNYFAEDALINSTDKPNSKQAIENCIENNIGIKTEVYLTKDRRAVISTYNDLSKEYGIDKKISESTLEELEAAGIKDIRTKCLRSNNPQNVVAATMEGLKSLRDAQQVAVVRGKDVSEL